MDTSKNIERHSTWTLMLSVFTFLLFITTHLLSAFRFELFGIVPGYAPHNFGFNMMFFIPSHFLMLGLAVTVSFRTAYAWRLNGNNKAALIRFGLTMPVFVVWGILLVRIAGMLLITDTN